MERIMLNNQKIQTSTILNPVEMDIDLEQEFFGAEENEDNSDNDFGNDVDLLGDFDLQPPIFMKLIILYKGAKEKSEAQVIEKNFKQICKIVGADYEIELKEQT